MTSLANTELLSTVYYKKKKKKKKHIEKYLLFPILIDFYFTDKSC